MQRTQTPAGASADPGLPGDEPRLSAALPPSPPAAPRGWKNAAFGPALFSVNVPITGLAELLAGCFPEGLSHFM